MSLSVKLNNSEVFLAATVGVRRMITSFMSPEMNKVANEKFGWHSDIEGACAEMAFAKATGMYWGGTVNTFKLPDVAGIQIRHTEYDNGHLIVREDDKDDEMFVLVTGKAPHFTVRGCLLGADAKRPEYFRGEGYPAWFVPQSALEPYLPPS